MIEKDEQVSYNYADLMNRLHEAVYFVDNDRRITFWNKAAERITGFAADEIVGTRCSDNVLIHIDEYGNSLCNGMCPLAATIEDGKPRDAEVYMHHRNGHRIPVTMRTEILRDEDGKPVGAAELFADTRPVMAMKHRVEELEQLAMLDDLTKLANRRYTEAEIEARLEEKRRYGLPFGILFLDVDHFKRFNDKFGHAYGDAVLKTVSSTLRASARPFDLIGRWGGEEFVAILRNVEGVALRATGERMRMLVESTRVPAEKGFSTVTVSVGATDATVEDTTASLVARADELMYESKRKGRNCVTADSGS